MFTESERILAAAEAGKMTHEEQLAEWVKGNPIHGAMYGNAEQDSSNTDGECCPDFSCCVPKLLWSQEKRDLFAASKREKRVQMLGGALAGLVEEEVTNVH